MRSVSPKKIYVYTEYIFLLFISQYIYTVYYIYLLIFLGIYIMLIFLKLTQ